MKKTMAGLCAALLMLSGVQTAALADGANEELDRQVYVSANDLDFVSSIDLPAVLKRALEDSDNLMLLQLKYAALNAKENDLKQQSDSLHGSLVTGAHLPDTPEEMIAAMNAQGVQLKPEENLWIGPMTTVTNKAVNQLIQGMGAMSVGINQMIHQQREQMKSAAHQLQTDQRNTRLQQEEAREGIRLQTIAQYVQLLGMKKQIAFMQEYQTLLEQELRKATLFKEEGLASSEDVLAAERALAKHKDELTILNQNYRLALLQLSFDIGIAYDPNLELKEIEDLSTAPIVEVDTETLLRHSFQMKMSANNIDEAAWQSDNSVTQNVYGEGGLAVNYAIAGTKNKQTQLELSKKIQATYTEAKNAYQSYLKEERNAEEAKADLSRMKFRYEVGVISRHDLRKFELKVRQSEASLEAAKLKYYVLREKAIAMEKGFIQ
ncbi:TolC family protein [Paenibacillus naphthalenovorans]|uniref:TolC family protein n=1 Tax=Paenibacillus naphthalenovorans TaxID=162209 RepID=UPI003D276004